MPRNYAHQLQAVIVDKLGLTILLSFLANSFNGALPYWRLDAKRHYLVFLKAVWNSKFKYWRSSSIVLSQVVLGRPTGLLHSAGGLSVAAMTRWWSSSGAVRARCTKKLTHGDYWLASNEHNLYGTAQYIIIQYNIIRNCMIFLFIWSLKLNCKPTLIGSARWVVVWPVWWSSILSHDCDVIFILSFPVKRRSRTNDSGVTIDTELLIVHADFFDPIQNLSATLTITLRHLLWHFCNF